MHHSPDYDRVEVEVAHEALLRHWPRLRAWLDEDRTALLLRESVREAAHEWNSNARDESYLSHRGRRLEQVEPLRAHPRLRLSPLEAAYLQASVDLRTREEQEREAQRQRFLTAERAYTERSEAVQRSPDSLAQAGHPPPPPAGAGMGVASPQRLPHVALIDLLLQISVTDDPRGRTVLLQGIPGRDTLSRAADNRRLDLDLIVDQLSSIGTLEDGVRPVVVLIDNALPYAVEGSRTHAELQRLRIVFARNPPQR